MSLAKKMVQSENNHLKVAYNHKKIILVDPDRQDVFKKIMI